MQIDRSIVLDANILMRAVLGKKARLLITEHAGHVAFYTPQVAYDDARRHLPAVFTKRGWNAEQLASALTVLDALEPVVHTVEEDFYAAKQSAALARIEKRDPDDWPFLAVALLLDCPVWTEDNDFFGTGVPIWTTDRVEIYLAESEPERNH
ncbi:PIN domain-containing protein [Isoptericola sp. G70]|uniref:PIN domain-containing protein n=1 Tax=Isoptericola sp. G70 TaxID=3376633 RepID=UPI003A80FC81